MPSVTLEVGAFVIVLVEWDAQPVVVEVDRPVQVLDFEEDFFDTSSIPTNPMAYLLVQSRAVSSSSFFINSCLCRLVARFEPWPNFRLRFSRQNQAPVSRSGRQLRGSTPLCRRRCALSK